MEAVPGLAAMARLPDLFQATPGEPLLSLEAGHRMEVRERHLPVDALTSTEPGRIEALPTRAQISATTSRAVRVAWSLATTVRS